MPLFSRSDEAERLFNEARRYYEPSSEEFDLDQAIRHLEAVVTLKPYEVKYHKKLREASELKSRLRESFLMKVEDVFVMKGGGLVAKGTVQRGTVRPGDKVRIVGPKGGRTDRVARLELFYRIHTRGLPGDTIGLLFEQLSGDSAQRGDTIEGMEA